MPDLGFSTHSTESSTSHSLLRRVKRNDADAWQRLIELYTPLICYWCRRSRLGPEDTEEVTQETFRAVYSGIGGLRHGGPDDTFRGWLRTIVSSKIANLIQRQRHSPGAAGGSAAIRQIEQLPDLVDDEETSVVNSLYQRAMQLIEDKFEPKTWQAFLLVVVQELSPEDVADRLGMTPGAVRNARWKVLRELRMQLGDEE